VDAVPEEPLARAAVGVPVVDERQHQTDAVRLRALEQAIDAGEPRLAIDQPSRLHAGVELGRVVVEAPGAHRTGAQPHARAQRLVDEIEPPARRLLLQVVGVDQHAAERPPVELEPPRAARHQVHDPRAYRARRPTARVTLTRRMEELPDLKEAGPADAAK